jgi:23S rRNA pseudouridine2605 synthase
MSKDSQPTKSHSPIENQQPDAIEGERLAKYLAHGGVASRRHAEELISAGAVKVNGEVITNLATRVITGRDVITVNGHEVILTTEHTTVALYKPAGYISTVHDPEGRPIITDLIPVELRARRLVPIGRLDTDSEGLILLSNDGDLILRLTHPRYEKEKEYHVLVSGSVTNDTLHQLQKGVIIDDDPRPTSPAIVQTLGRSPYGNSIPGTTWLSLVLHEGRKRQIRRMCDAVGLHVEKLVRVRVGQLYLHEIATQPGAWKKLGDAELRKLTAQSPSIQAKPRSLSRRPMNHRQRK